jgi:Entner-Doudoroff aldolase
VPEFFGEHLGSSRVMAILRGYGPSRTAVLCQRAWDLGIGLVEVPVQSEDDLVALRQAVALGRERSRLVGAGTVTSVALVEQVVEAGAAFTVAPGLDERVVEASRAVGLPHLPGVGTATEIHHALGLGLTWLKAFPAAALGAAWVSAMRGPFPQARLVATGGIDLENARDFLAAGAAAVSFGSAFAAADAEQLRALATASTGDVR